MEGQFVAYYRVSTQRQGRSGLGLEAQRQAVEHYLNGGHWELIGEFTDVESGKNDHRPELSEALALCKKTGATLCIAKLDRLSRKVSFIASLMDAGVRFVAVDNAAANELTLHILSAVAQAERKAISKRTKEALAAAKARGVKLGNPRLAEARRGINESRRRQAEEFAESIKPALDQAMATGASSLRALAFWLNDHGYRTFTGKNWSPMGVKRLQARL